MPKFKLFLIATILFTLFIASTFAAPPALADCVSEGGHCIPGLNSCEFTEYQLSGATLCPDAGQKCCTPGGPGCYTGSGGEGIDTAIGCIPVSNVNDTAAFFLRWGMGIAGGLALILIVYASFLIITSAGNPKGVQAGKELLVSALAGLLFLIFGVFALRIIGVDILGIPFL